MGIVMGLGLASIDIDLYRIAHMSVGWLDNPEFRIFAVLVAFAIELDMIEISIVAEGVVLVLLNVAHDATVEIVDVKFQVVSVDFGKGVLQLVGRMMVRHTPS